MIHQKRIPLTACSDMQVFTVDYPNVLVLEDMETDALHIYELDETETAPTVVVAYGLDYRFTHIASKEEEKELRERKRLGQLKSVPTDEDEVPPSFEDVLLQAEKINAVGSDLEN
jgi:hypothetical protein